MANFDDRIVRVSIEVRGKFNVYEGLAIVASGNKVDNPTQNDCTIRIANLAKDVRDYIVTETSPFNKNRTPKRVIVEAGRKSTGTFVVFTGEIQSATITQPPDIWLEMKCLTGSFMGGKIIARSQPANTSLRQIATQIAADLDLILQFEATDRRIASYTHTGSALNQVKRLQDMGNVNAYVDDGLLIVKDKDIPIKTATSILSMDSGMVGKPELTEQGIKVTYMLDSASRLGGKLQVKSVLNPAANGEYVIYKLGFNIASRDTPFYYTAEAKRT